MSEQKIKVTPEQLGQLLFGFVSTHTTGRLKDAEYLRSIGVEHIDQNYLLREMLIINMFAIVQGFKDLLENEELETKVLDHMHKTYYQALVEYLKTRIQPVSATPAALKTSAGVLKPRHFLGR